MALQIVKPLTFTEKTLTRASVGYYFDTADGLLKSAAIDVPRFDEHEGCLIEAAATNLLLRSADTSNASWTKLGATTATTPLVTSPDGTANCNTVTSLLDIGINQTATVVASTAYVFSMMIKAGSATSVKMQESGSASASVIFDCTTQTFSSAVNTTSYGYYTLPSGWYRIWMKFTTGVGTTANIVISPSTSGTNTFYPWGMMLEAGTYPSSYFPSVASAGVRSADVSAGYGMLTTLPETDYAAWNSGTAYGTAGGTRVIIAATHKVYESLPSALANTNKPPATEPTYWIEVGSTNRWKAFDTVISTQMTATTSMSFALRDNSIINSIGFVNVSGTSIRVRVEDPSTGLIVYDVTKSLVGTITLPDWYNYFFSVTTPTTQAIFVDLPPIIGGLITVDMLGSTCSIGVCVAGYKISFGYGIQTGAAVGIQDYSKKDRDTFGEVTFTQRSFSKRVSVSMILDTNEIDSTLEALAALRAVPALYIGSTDYQSTIVYWFYRYFNIGINYSSAADCSLEIEGLV